MAKKEGIAPEFIVRHVPGSVTCRVSNAHA